MRKTLSFIFFVLFSSSCFAGQAVTLDKAINSALLNNEQILVAQKKMEAAQARVSQTFSGYLPSLSLSSNLSRSYSSPVISKIEVGGINTDVVFGFGEPSNVRSWQASLSQNLFTFGKLENSLMIVLDAAQAEKEQLRKAKQEVIYGTTSAYFNLVKAIVMLKYAQESVDMAQAHLDQVQAMLNVGMAVKSDLLRSQVALLSARQGLIKAGNAAELAKASFNNVIGRPLDDPIDVADTDFSSFEKSESRTYAQILKDAYEFRPDWRQANYSLSISEKNLNMSKANWLPSIAAQANYGWNNTSYPASQVNYDQTNWSVAAAASWKIFDGFNIQSRIKEASAGLDEARAARELARKSVELEVKQAYLNYISSKDVIETAGKALESAAENYDAASLRYENGLATNIEVLDAQVSLTKAETDLLTAQFDLCLARAQIRKASGVLDHDWK